MDLICRWQRYANNIIYQKIWLMQLSELQLKNRRGLMKTPSLKQIDASISCVCPVSDQEFRHTIVKAWIRRQLWKCYEEINGQ